MAASIQNVGEVGSEGWTHQDVLSSTGIFDVTFESDKTSSNTSGIYFGGSSTTSSGSESLQECSGLNGTTQSEPGPIGNQALSTTTRSEPPVKQTRKKTSKTKSKVSPAEGDGKDKVVKRGRKLKEPAKAKAERKGKKEEPAKPTKITKPKQKNAGVNKMSTIAEVSSPTVKPSKTIKSVPSVSSKLDTAEEEMAVQTRSKAVKKKVVPTKESSKSEATPKVAIKKAAKPKTKSEGASKKAAGGSATKVDAKPKAKAGKATLVKKGGSKKTVKPVSESETSLTESEAASDKSNRGNNSSRFNSSATTDGGTSGCDSSVLNSTSEGDTLGSTGGTSIAGEGSDGGEAERTWRESQSCSRVVSKISGNVHPGRRSGIFSPPKTLGSPTLGVVREEEEDDLSPLGFPTSNHTAAPQQGVKDRRRTYVINIAMALDLDEEKESAVAQLIDNNPNVKIEPPTPKKPPQKAKDSKKGDPKKATRNGRRGRKHSTSSSETSSESSSSDESTSSSEDSRVCTCSSSGQECSICESSSSEEDCSCCCRHSSCRHRNRK